MVILMLPFFLLAMYEKNGQPLEKILRNMIRVCFLRPRQRPDVYKRQDIHKGVVVHRFFEVNRIQYLNAVARPLHQLPALNQNRTFRVG